MKKIKKDPYKIDGIIELRRDMWLKYGSHSENSRNSTALSFWYGLYCLGDEGMRPLWRNTFFVANHGQIITEANLREKARKGTTDWLIALKEVIEEKL